MLVGTRIKSCLDYVNVVAIAIEASNYVIVLTVSHACDVKK